MIKQLVLIVTSGLLSVSLHAQKKQALVIGINDYYETKGVKSDVSLLGSVNDANAIRQLLISRFGFKSTDIDTIYNEKATRDNILAGLKKKLRQCRPGDAMVFYFSGHGVYLYNTQEKLDPVKRGMNQAMLTSDLYNYDDHLKCFLRDFTLKEYFNLFIDKKIILTTIFDCCFSGNLSMAGTDVDFSEQTKSVDLQALFGRLTQDVANPQLLIDSITGMPSAVPKGCAVDSAGAITDKLDSDGDGVPDCKDKQKFTDKRCFPVDGDGVGNCPFDYILESFGGVLSKYDPLAPAVAPTLHPVGAEKAFAASAVINISEKDTIMRPVDRKDSKFLFISATTDLQKAVEFNDEKGVRHSFFTAAMIRVFQKNDANLSVDSLFQKISDDMNGYHRNQNPTLYADPARKKINLIGLEISRRSRR